MGFNIFEDTETIPDRANSNTTFQNETVQDIFYQHATQGQVSQMQGRAWELLDSKHEGVLHLEDFMTGVAHLLEPSTPQMMNFVERLKQGLVTPVPHGKDYASVKRIAIVGGGVAGLQVARQLGLAGKECVIFEKSKDVGGVWRENYADFGLQVPKELYEFGGFPWPTNKEWNLFPKGEEVQEYIQLFAKEYNLYELCHFETAVLALNTITGKDGWAVKYQKKGQEIKTEEFDFCVVTTGMYGWPPHIPKARGHKKFKGDILHSCTFTDRNQAVGKKVVVVGGGKSAVDNAVSAAKVGKSSTLLTRSLHWPVPRYLANFVPFKFGTYSRFGHFMLPTPHDEGDCFWWMHSTCAPVKRVWWKVVETMFKVQFSLSSEHTPETRMDYDLFNGGQIITYELRDMVKAGTLNHTIGTIDYFKENSVVLMDGTEIETDMVIYGTGFAKNYDLFDDTFVKPLLDIQKDGLYLYRNIIPPKIANLAFVGSEVSTFNNILTHGLQAVWLKKVMKGEVELPRIGGMEQVIEKERAWKRSWMPPSSARASIWQLHMMKYHDNLCKDMGEKYKRKCDPISEALMPYSAADYRDLFA